MALPCIDDTCSVRAAKNPTTKHLQLDVKTSPSGGLYCRGDNTGLAVQLLGEPDNDDAVTDQGFIKLKLTGGGELWVAPERAVRHSFASSEPVGIPSAAFVGNESQNPIDTNASLVNPFANDALLIVKGRFEVGWTIPLIAEAAALSTGTGIKWTPFGAEVETFFKTDYPDDVPPPFNVVASFVSVCGVWPRDKAPHNGRDWRDFMFVGVIGGGKTMNFSASAKFIVPEDAGDYPYNLSFLKNSEANPGFPDRGFACRGTATILPIGA